MCLVPAFRRLKEIYNSRSDLLLPFFPPGSGQGSQQPPAAPHTPRSLPQSGEGPFVKDLSENPNHKSGSLTPLCPGFCWRLHERGQGHQLLTPTGALRQFSPSPAPLLFEQRDPAQLFTVFLPPLSFPPLLPYVAGSELCLTRAETSFPQGSTSLLAIKPQFTIKICTLSFTLSSGKTILRHFELLFCKLEHTP